MIIFALAYTVLGVVFPLQQVGITLPYVIGVVIVGILYGFLLGVVMLQLAISRKMRILVVLLPLFVIQFFNPMIEGFFFTTILDNVVILVAGALFGLLLSFLYALLAGVLFVPVDGTSSFSHELREYFGQRRPLDWLGRYVLAAFAWVLIYFIFGNIVAPFVAPYYADPSSPWYLILPSVEIVLMIQVLRGFIYLGSLIPLLTTLRLEPKQLFLVMVAFLYIGGGLAIFAIVETFPLFLRLIHGIEIFASSLCFGAVIALLLKRTSKPPETQIT